MRAVFPNRTRIFRVLGFGLTLLLLIIVFRANILALLGSYLDNSDEPTQVDALFVLGGSPVDRGIAAVQYFEQGLVLEELVCTGGNVAGALAAYNIHVTESTLSRKVLEDRGVPGDRIVELTTSTSTFEEAIESLDYSRERGWKRIGILSSEYHLRRVSLTFDKAFADESIELVYFRANSTHFNPDDWWKNEEGFLTCFSEYAKLLFYLLNY